MIWIIASLGFSLTGSVLLNVALYALWYEQGKALQDATKERDIERQEVKALTEALARGNRTPILRDLGKPRKLESSESYWAGKEEIKITPA